MTLYCNNCHRVVLPPHAGCPDCPPPPNVINFDGRSPEARRIADLEKRIEELEATVEQHESGGVFHCPLPPSEGTVTIVSSPYTALFLWPVGIT